MFIQRRISCDTQSNVNCVCVCVGGHDELVELLISHGANIEHRDKKGCTPLILAASAGESLLCLYYLHV